MSDSLGLALTLIFNDLLPGVIGVYAAYWAISIRRALVGGIYRNHALWLGAICIIFGVGSPIENISSSNTIISLAISLFIAATLAVLIAFVDSTIPVARRSDPLNRSILRWEKVRLVVWGDVCLLSVFLAYSALNPSFDSSAWAASGFPIFFVAFVLGVPAVLIAAKRSRDPLLRWSLAWFGAALLLALVRAIEALVELVVLGISTYDTTYSYPALAFAPAFILGAYFLYRSARSLAPVNRFETLEPEPSPPAGAATSLTR